MEQISDTPSVRNFLQILNYEEKGVFPIPSMQMQKQYIKLGHDGSFHIPGASRAANQFLLEMSTLPMTNYTLH